MHFLYSSSNFLSFTHLAISRSGHISSSCPNPSLFLMYSISGISFFILCKSCSLFLYLLSLWCPLQYVHFAVVCWRSFVEVYVLLLYPSCWHLEHLPFILLFFLGGFSFWSGILLLTLEVGCMFSVYWWMLCPVFLRFQQYSFMLQFEQPAGIGEGGGGGRGCLYLRSWVISSLHLL